jgi:drug/metabolite transporter (DMT)-like permease
MSLYGEIAALLTAVCWTFTSVVFTIGGKRIGSVTVNRMRIWMAFFAMCVIHALIFGTPFPFDIESHRFFYLAVSGIIGLAVGDGFLLESFVLIGPRLAMLLMLLTPVFSAFLAWTVLGEVLVPVKIAGILVTMGGIAWVVLEKTTTSPTPQPQNKSPEKTWRYTLGILLGLGGAVGQAIGLLLSRLGLEGGYSAISGNHVRITAAAVVLAVYAALRGRIRSHFHKIKDKKILLLLISGTLSGTVLGVILSLEAITHTQIGVASTLMSLSPVLLIPAAHVVFKEKITSRAIIGTVVALAGVALLFFNF